MENKELKMFTLDQIKDEFIWEKGTEKRNIYEQELQLEVLGDLIRKVRLERNPPLPLVANEGQLRELFELNFVLLKKDMLTKEKIKRTIDALPEHFTIEDVIEELIVIDKIEQGLKDVEEGNVYTTEEVKQRLSKWLK